MPITKIKPKRTAQTKKLFEEMHGVSLAEVAARAAFPPRVADSKKELPRLVVVDEALSYNTTFSQTDSLSMEGQIEPKQQANPFEADV